jgi:signal transduction histidine kinase
MKMTIEESAQNTPTFSYEELYQQTIDLRHELADLKTKQRMVWVLFVDASRKLQISTASIKAAVSSLLNYDIFWDGANQHEFLTTIDASVDQVAKLTSLLVLTVRSEEGSLELKFEPHSLQEIISVVQHLGATSFPKLVLDINLPNEGKSVLVDYEYLTTALGLLCEVFEARLQSPFVRLQAIEEQNRWLLDFYGIDSTLMQQIQWSLDWQVDALPAVKALPLDYLLRLYIVHQILHLQGIEVEVLAGPTGDRTLRLLVPAVADVVIGQTPKG